jgi:single-strand DNA-binding protein
MVNKVMLLGRLGQDPEIKYLQDGSMVANIRIATDEQWKDKNGEKVQKTEWHRATAFKKLAEICGNYLNKGSLIFITGKLQTRSWDDKDGNKRYITEIIMQEMRMIGGKTESQKSSDDVPF